MASRPVSVVSVEPGKGLGMHWELIKLLYEYQKAAKSLPTRVFVAGDSLLLLKPATKHPIES